MMKSIFISFCGIFLCLTVLAVETPYPDFEETQQDMQYQEGFVLHYTKPDTSDILMFMEKRYIPDLESIEKLVNAILPYRLTYIESIAHYQNLTFIFSGGQKNQCIVMDEAETVRRCTTVEREVAQTFPQAQPFFPEDQEEIFDQSSINTRQLWLLFNMHVLNAQVLPIATLLYPMADSLEKDDFTVLYTNDTHTRQIIEYIKSSMKYQEKQWVLQLTKQFSTTQMGPIYNIQSMTNVHGRVLMIGNAGNCMAFTMLTFQRTTSTCTEEEKQIINKIPKLVLTKDKVAELYEENKYTFLSTGMPKEVWGAIFLLMIQHINDPDTQWD